MFKGDQNKSGHEFDGPLSYVGGKLYIERDPFFIADLEPGCYFLVVRLSINNINTD